MTQQQEASPSVTLTDDESQVDRILGQIVEIVEYMQDGDYEEVPSADEIDFCTIELALATILECASRDALTQFGKWISLYVKNTMTIDMVLSAIDEVHTL